MNRREALRNVAILMGTAVSATTLSVLAAGCNTTSPKNGELFTAQQQNVITELAETIIPTTGTPGAKAAGVGPFITMMITECYPEKVQKTFLDGLADLEKRSNARYSGSFENISAPERTLVLQGLVDDLKSKTANKVKEKAVGGKRGGQSRSQNVNFFQLAKELTMLGYFTSEIGAKQALAYIPIPGRYDGCTDMTPGQKAWAL